MIVQSSVLNSSRSRNFVVCSSVLLYIVAFINLVWWRVETDCVTIYNYPVLIAGVACLVLALITSIYCHCCLCCETFTSELRYANLPDRQPINLTEIKLNTL